MASGFPPRYSGPYDGSFGSRADSSRRGAAGGGPGYRDGDFSELAAQSQQLYAHVKRTEGLPLLDRNLIEIVSLCYAVPFAIAQLFALRSCARILFSTFLAVRSALLVLAYMEVACFVCCSLFDAWLQQHSCVLHSTCSLSAVHHCQLVASTFSSLNCTAFTYSALKHSRRAGSGVTQLSSRCSSRSSRWLQRCSRR
jgi:hypothetical protein